MKKVIYFGENVLADVEQLMTEGLWNTVPDTLFTIGEFNQQQQLIVYTPSDDGYTSSTVNPDFIKEHHPVSLVIVRHGSVGEQDKTYVGNILSFLDSVASIPGLWSSIIMVMCYGLRATVSDKPLVEIVSQKTSLPVVCFEGVATGSVIGNSLIISSSEGHVYTVRSEPKYNAIGSALVL